MHVIGITNKGVCIVFRSSRYNLLGKDQKGSHAFLFLLLLAHFVFRSLNVHHTQLESPEMSTAKNIIGGK